MYGHHGKRKKLSGRKSRSMFSRVAQHIHPVNVHSVPMRGGFRL